MILNNKTKSAHILWALFFLLTLLGCYLQTEGNITASVVIIASTVFMYVLFSNEVTLSNNKYIWLALAALIIFSLFNSKLLMRSMHKATFYTCAFYFYCCLIDNKLGYKKNHIDLIKITVWLVLAYVTIHSFFSLRQYYLVPIRTIGLFRDYSQASFAILAGFILAYPYLRHRKHSYLLTVFLFAAFFSSFSRTSNLLLIIALTALTLYEYRKGALRFIAPHLLAVAVGYLLVSIYPSISSSLDSSSELIDRGGLRDLNTLNSRVYYWAAAFESIKGNWLWGTGLGSYEFTGIRGLVPFEMIVFAHNDYLEVLHDLGIFWLTAFLYLLASTLLSFCNAILHVVKDETGDVDSIFNFVAWILVFCMCMYMCINFIATTYFFILIFTLSVAILHTNKILKDEVI